MYNGRSFSLSSAEVGSDGKDAVAMDVLDAIQLIVEDLDRQIAHPDLIEVGKTDRTSKIAFFGLLPVLDIFTADTGRGCLSSTSHCVIDRTYYS